MTVQELREKLSRCKHQNAEVLVFSPGSEEAGYQFEWETIFGVAEAGGVYLRTKADVEALEDDGTEEEYL